MIIFEYESLMLQLAASWFCFVAYHKTKFREPLLALSERGEPLSFARCRAPVRRG